ncbi:hypothetical protein KGQ24_03300 [Patescibacteria group bacterium]|nr:hypothetical protein [Patescibacteria group bacterium]
MNNMKKISALVFIGLIAASCNNKMISTQPTTQPAAVSNTQTSQVQQNSTDVNIGGKTNLYTSYKLGVSFTYESQAGYNQNKVTEQGNTITLISYVNGAALTHNSIEVFNKDSNMSLADAIMKNLSLDPSKCVVNVRQASGTFQKAYILLTNQSDYTSGDGSNAPMLCSNYQSFGNGVYYFLADTAHPDKYAYVSIGQDAISADDKGNNLTWADTISFK